MSWFLILAKTYDAALASGDSDVELLPTSHSTQQADVEVVCDLDGNFKSAKVVERGTGDGGAANNKVTLIPVTEDSASRSRGLFPHPLHDKLQYVAADFEAWGAEKESYFSDYIMGLKAWSDSEYSHPYIKAVYDYLRKGTLISDLVAANVLYSETEQTLMDKEHLKKLEVKPEIYKTMTNKDQFEAFVRFSVQPDPLTIVELWRDEEIIRLYTEFDSARQEESGLCYATGEVVPLMTKHPSKIRHSGDKAKLVSANDKSGFTYRGRFLSAEENAQIGYTTAQKAYSALKWLIEKQGKRFGGKVFVTWGSDLEEVPDFTASSSKIIRDSDDLFAEGDGDYYYNDQEIFALRLRRALDGYKERLDVKSNLAILVLDAAVPGRMAINLFQEYKHESKETLFQNVESWHQRCGWFHQGAFDQEKRVYNSTIEAPSLYWIAALAFGVQRGDKVEVHDKVLGQSVLRLLPCVLDQQAIPVDIVRALVSRAKRPQAYSRVNWNRLLSAACSMTRGYLMKQGFSEADWQPSLIRDNFDLGYNLGRQLAVAQYMERLSFDGDGNKREPVALRYFTAYMENPCKTWAVISERLAVYWEKVALNHRWLAREASSIANQIDPTEFASARNLDGRALMGYQMQLVELFSNSKNKKVAGSSEESLQVPTQESHIAGINRASISLYDYEQNQAYLLGRLVAVLDHCEANRLWKLDTNRVSNARRRLAMFAQNPNMSLLAMIENIQFVLEGQGRSAEYWLSQMGEIAAQIDWDGFMRLRGLDGRFQLGFDAQQHFMSRPLEEQRTLRQQALLKADYLKPKMIDDSDISVQLAKLWHGLHKAERIFLDVRLDEPRATNAIRYLSAFQSYPYQTWERVNAVQQQSMKRAPSFAAIYQDVMDEVRGSISEVEFKEARRLDAKFILGFLSFVFWDKSRNLLRQGIESDQDDPSALNNLEEKV